MRMTRLARLRWFEQNRSNRTREELAELFTAWGWVPDRQTGKEGRLWIKGAETFLFPGFHRGKLKLGYVTEALRAIKRADPEWESDDEEG